ncbi:MAG: hemerythrin domain-containing protein [Proteobacteria bacterium]|nr:hemerythrin domain-containing protein [Pseudomonadota bacterium]
MSRTIAALKRDHANIAKLLDILESEILAIKVGKTPDYSLMQDIMRYLTQHSDRFHHPKEDLIFARLLKRDTAIRAEVEALIEEHILIGLAGQEFAGLLVTSGADTVESREQLGASGQDYIRNLREHMSREEGKLFPTASVVLTKKDWHFIDTAADAINDPLFDDMTADDYKRLYRLITEQSESGRWAMNPDPPNL